MLFKDVNVGDMVFGVGTDAEGRSYVVGRTVVALEADGSGEFVRFVERDALMSCPCSEVEKSVFDLAARIKMGKSGYVCCLRCGKLVDAKEALAVGGVDLCPDCVRDFQQELTLRPGEQQPTAEGTEAVEEV